MRRPPSRGVSTTPASGRRERPGHAADHRRSSGRLDRDGVPRPARLPARGGRDASSRPDASRARWATATIAAPRRCAPTAPTSSPSASTTSPTPISPSCWPRSRRPPPRAGRSILLGTYGENLDRQDRVLRTLKEYRPDGMILCAAGGTTAERSRATSSRPASRSCSSRARSPGLELDFVGSDDQRMAPRLAVEHLLELGPSAHRDARRHRRASRPVARAARAIARRWRGMACPSTPALIYDGYGTRETGLTRHPAPCWPQPIRRPPPSASTISSAFGAMLGLRHLRPGGRTGFLDRRLRRRAGSRPVVSGPDDDPQSTGRDGPQGGRDADRAHRQPSAPIRAVCWSPGWSCAGRRCRPWLQGREPSGRLLDREPSRPCFATKQKSGPEGPRSKSAAALREFIRRPARAR